VPDLVLLLMVPPAQALERIRQARGQVDDVFEREDHLARVDSVYRTLMGPHVHSVDAGQPIEVVTAAMQQKIQEILTMHHLTSSLPGRAWVISLFLLAIRVSINISGTQNFQRGRWSVSTAG
jgi:hypothetical protein